MINVYSERLLYVSTFFCNIRINVAFIVGFCFKFGDGGFNIEMLQKKCELIVGTINLLVQCYTDLFSGRKEEVKKP
jgi:hypothetical protein